MLNSWIALIVIWAIVELIGMALKINYSKRMKYGAICVGADGKLTHPAD